MGRLGGRLRHRAATLPRGRSKALFVHSDSEAIGMVERAPDRGLTVRGGLAVVSYDDEVAAASGPPLTAVRTQRRRLGSQAAETVLARMADPTKRPTHCLELWPTLAVRASCGGEERASSSSDG
ncbi:substrate-binding domain-containing protein [Streptomyces rimosus]|nr:substrate-binding domain-containing protein [Streptomyces rimosus]